MNDKYIMQQNKNGLLWLIKNSSVYPNFSDRYSWTNIIDPDHADPKT